MQLAPALPSANPAPQTLLSFDFGTRRVGVAAGNTLLRQAQALRTVAAQGDARFAAIARLIDEWRPAALVVGVPFHPDGAAHDNTRRARRFPRQLDRRCPRLEPGLSSRSSATVCLRQGAADADAAAAALILNQFFQQGFFTHDVSA